MFPTTKSQNAKHSKTVRVSQNYIFSISIIRFGASLCRRARIFLLIFPLDRQLAILCKQLDCPGSISPLEKKNIKNPFDNLFIMDLNSMLTEFQLSKISSFENFIIPYFKSYLPNMSKLAN